MVKIKKTKGKEKIDAIFMIVILIAANFAFAAMLSENAVAAETAGAEDAATPGAGDAALGLGYLVPGVGPVVGIVRVVKPLLEEGGQKKIKEALKKKQEWGDFIFTAISVGMSIWKTIDMVFGKGGNEFGVCDKEDKKAGTDYCSYCNKDPFMACTADRCRQLGECTPTPTEGEEGIVCLEGLCEEEGLVMIDEMKVSWQGGDDWLAGSESAKRKGERLTLNLSQELPHKVTSLNLNITTNVYSKCRYGIDEGGKDKSYDNLADFEKMTWSKSHSVEVPLSAFVARGEEHKIYIKCTSACEETHSPEFNEFRVEFTFEEIPETAPPVIMNLDPDSNYFYPSVNNVIVSFSLNENGYCKYSTKLESLTTEWDEMLAFGVESPGGFVPKPAHPNYPDDVSVKEAYCLLNEKCALTAITNCAKCFVTLDLTRGAEEINWSNADYSGINPTIASEVQAQQELEGVSKIVFIALRCADLGKDGQANPAAAEGTADDNIMLEGDAEIYFFKTADPYNITILKPTGNVDEKSIPIEVNTTRYTKCRYSIDEEKIWGDMLAIDDDAFSNTHIGEVTGIAAKKHTIHVKCMDMLPLLQKASQQFFVVADVSAPLIIRAYYAPGWGEGLLAIITNEEAVCKYITKSTPGCAFEFDQETPIFTSVDEEGLEHAAAWGAGAASGRTYYIKCKDWKGNGPPAGSCTMIVHPYSVIRR